MGKVKVKMAALIRSLSLGARSFQVNRVAFAGKRHLSSQTGTADVVTHTGQKFEDDDVRRTRFIDRDKLVNQQFAIDLIREDPVVVCENRVVFSDSGGPLGHSRVYINLDPPEVHTCGYSGRKFILKKYYNEKEHGPSITYDEYLTEMNSQPKDYPM